MSNMTSSWSNFNNATLGFINLGTIGAKDSLGILDLSYGEWEKSYPMHDRTNLIGPVSPLYTKLPDIYLPRYKNILGISKVLICTTQKKYGNIGDIIKVEYQYSENEVGDYVNNSFYAIIGKHMEDVDISNPSVRGIGQENGKECIVSLIVKVNTGDNVSWLDNMREKFFDGKEKYKTCNIISIERVKSINGDLASTSEEEAATAASDFLLQPSDDERKYGINIYEASQQLIRFSTSAGVTGAGGGDALIALKNYSIFLYYLLNSQVLTANYLLVNMPWLRPGFNVWVDPLYSDTVYYLQEVQHQGDPVSGASTSVSLICGRPRSSYVNDPNAFGSIKSANDNVFVNTINDDQKVAGSNGDGPWGRYVADAADFNNIKTATEEYYSHEIEGTTHATESSFHKELYVNGRKNAPISSNVDSSKIFNGEYTANEIQAKLDSIYSSAPQVVQDRVAKLNNAVTEARKYIELHYDKETKV